MRSSMIGRVPAALPGYDRLEWYERANERWVMSLMVESKQPALMHGVSWDFYSRTLQEIGPSRGTRVTYDNGRMEIVTSSNLHERAGSTIGRMIEAYASIMEI